MKFELESLSPIKDTTKGSDPEFAVVNKITGEPISAHNLVPGSKAHPSDIGRGCGVQPDGVMVEATIPPATTEEEFVDSILYSKRTIEEIIQQTNPDLCVRSVSSLRYADDQLTHPSVREFGCQASYCIYTASESVRPTAEEVGSLRSAGFHIHIGTPRYLNFKEIEALMFCMDVQIGLPSVVLDLDTERRQLYGNAGDFRFKHLTDLTIVEYRTLGGNLSATEEHIRWVYRQTDKAISMYNNFKNFIQRVEDFHLVVKEAIDTGNVEEARKLMKIFNVKCNVAKVHNENLVYEQVF